MSDSFLQMSRSLPRFTGIRRRSGTGDAIIRLGIRTEM